MERNVNQPPSPEKMTEWQELALRLEILQAAANPGMGVSCVRNIIGYLRRGDIKSARAVANTDHDKIRNYPTITELLIREGFMEELPSFPATKK